MADENFRNAIIRGLLRRTPSIDLVRAQDIPDLAGRDDSALIRFATAERLVLLTHDVSTMIPALERELRTSSCCGPIVFVPDSLPVAATIEDLLLLHDCATQDDWESRVLYLPLR